MRSPKPIHHLTNVDREHRTAVCSICGPTRIYLANRKTQHIPQAYCVNRAQASTKSWYQTVSSQKRSKKRHHKLSQIDPNKMTAICAICGPTDIRKRTVKQGIRYLCATQKRKYAAKYRNSRYPSHPRANSPLTHYLSQIDYVKRTAICTKCGFVHIYVWKKGNRVFSRCSNASNEVIRQARKKRKEQNLIFLDAYKREHGCQNCGNKKDPSNLEFHSRDRDKRRDKVLKFTVLTQEKLLKELKKYDVLCNACHIWVHEVNSKHSHKRRHFKPHYNSNELGVLGKIQV